MIVKTNPFESANTPIDSAGLIEKVLSDYGEIANPFQLKELFIQLVAPLVVETALIATGKKDDYDSSNSFSIKEAWNLASEMMKAANDIKRIEAQNISEVLKLLPKGKFTIGEIKELMQIMAIKTDIEVAEAILKYENK